MSPLKALIAKLHKAINAPITTISFPAWPSTGTGKMQQGERKFQMTIKHFLYLITLIITCHVLADPFGCMDCNAQTIMSSQDYTALRTTLSFSIVEGIFAQSDPATDPTQFNFARQNLGLLNESWPLVTGSDHTASEGGWPELHEYIRELNEASSGLFPIYKLIFASRHGEGYHNVAEAKYGTPAWNDKWSKLDGDGVLYWRDAELTDLGVQQAKAANEVLKDLVQTKGLKLPGSFWTSPLRRALHTAELNWDRVSTAPKSPRTVKELLREVFGVHTCDERSRKSWIRSHYPSWKFERGFAEEDELWQPDYRETDPETDARMKRLLTDLFLHDHDQFTSFTSHSGAIGSILRVVHHRTWPLKTGEVLPIVVKAVVADGEVLDG